MKTQILSLLLSLILSIGFAEKQPNIVFIMADDLGWTDLSSSNTSLGNGSKYYETPNIDKLATDGMSFSYAYTQQNCQPTRAALHSGQYSTGPQNGVYNVGSLHRATKGVVTPIVPHDQINYLSEQCVSMFETVKTVGYHTAWFGKLHAIKTGEHAESYLGVDYNIALRKETKATVNGVKVDNEFFAQNDDKQGWMFSHDSLKPYAQPYDSTYIHNVLEPIKNGNDPWRLLGTPKHLTDALGDAVVDYIEERAHEDKPFFAYVPFHAVHVSILPRADLEAKLQGKKSKDPRHNRADYAAFVELLDQTVGRILNALDDPNGDGDTSDGIAENTLVVFYSDNGGFMGPTDNTPLRARKGTYYEGGVRVPLIFSYPGTIAPNTVNSVQEIHAIDFYPTLAEMVGAQLPNPLEHAIDGKSVASVLKGETKANEDKTELFWHFPGYMDVRNMPQSVIHYRHSNNQHYKLFYRYEDSSYELYNLSEDIGETTNLLAGDPDQAIIELAITMNNKLREWLIENKAPTGTWRDSGEAVAYPPLNMENTSTSTKGFEATNPSSKIKLFPNPSTDYVSIEGGSETGGEIRILDLFGNLVKYETFFTQKVQVDLAALRSGTYIINVNQAGRTTNLKLTNL